MVDLSVIYSMNCYHSIKIQLPVNQVIELMNNPDYYKEWQRGLLSTELIKGKSGQVGAKRRIFIKIAGRKVKMIETILNFDPPHKWEARYTSQGLTSLQKNLFTPIDEHTTLWECYSEFKFSGSMIIISKVMPQVFKERARLTQVDFKKFAENFH